MSAPDRAAGLAARLGALRGHPLLRSGFGLGGLALAETALGLVTAVLLARELGAEGLGVYSLAVAVATLAGLPVEFGLPALITREVAHATAAGSNDLVKGVLGFATAVIAVMTIVVGALALAFAGAFESHLGAGAGSILPLALLLIPIGAFSRLGGAALAGRQRVVLGSVPLRLVRPAALALGVAAFSLGAPGWLSPGRAIAIQVAAGVLALALSAVLFGRHFAGTLRRRGMAITWRPWLVATVRLGLSNGMTQAQPQLLLLLTGALGTLEDVGLLRVAQRGVGLIGAGTAIAPMAAAPRFAALHTEGRPQRLQRLVTLVGRVMTGIALVGLLLVLLAGKWLLGMLFGADFTAAWGALAVLSGGVVVRVLFGPGVMLTNMLRREDLAMFGLGISLVLSVAAGAVLIPALGVLGAAWGATIGGVSMAVFLWQGTRRALAIDSAVLVRAAPAPDPAE